MCVCVHVAVFEPATYVSGYAVCRPACKQRVWDPTHISQDGLGVSLHMYACRWATPGETGPNGAPGPETRREDNFLSRGLENKWLFQNKWGSSAPAMERAAKRLLGGKGHANIGLIPPSSCCLQGCSSNIPASCAPRCCKATGSCPGIAPCPGVLPGPLLWLPQTCPC